MERESREKSNRRSAPRLRDLPWQDLPWERLKQHGEQALSTIELLAILLGTGYKGGNALQLAQVLLAELGGLRGMAQASAAELQAIHGIGPAKATQIKASFELGGRLMTTPVEEQRRVQSPFEAAKLAMLELANLEQEQVCLILLDTRNQVLATPVVHNGGLDPATVDTAGMLRIALRLNTAAFIVAHNQPSGDLSPSPEDVQLTEQLVEAGRLLDIELLDHVIISGDRYLSLKERGLGFQ